MNLADFSVDHLCLEIDPQTQQHSVGGSRRMRSGGRTWRLHERMSVSKMFPSEGSQGVFLLGELAPECQPSINSGWISINDLIF